MLFFLHSSDLCYDVLVLINLIQIGFLFFRIMLSLWILPTLVEVISIKSVKILKWDTKKNYHSLIFIHES